MKELIIMNKNTGDVSTGIKVSFFDKFDEEVGTHCQFRRFGVTRLLLLKGMIFFIKILNAKKILSKWG